MFEVPVVKPGEVVLNVLTPCGLSASGQRQQHDWGAGILNGDLLAVHRTGDVRSGQIVVARLGDEVTVKRLKRRGSRIELLAENPDYPPIVVNVPLTIEGLVVGLIRDGRTL